MENNIYSLKITGSIIGEKHKEFQQTVQFVFNHLSPGCLVHALALDVFQPNVYHLFTMWNSKEALALFKISNEYQLLKGAYQTLGLYESTINSKLADVQLFEVIRIES
jgi:quinol monooxygenase YgiN